jgi:pilus assembly protein CpaE
VLDDPKHPVSQAIKLFGERHVVGGTANADSDIPPGLRTDRRGLRRWRTKTT